MGLSLCTGDIPKPVDGPGWILIFQWKRWGIPAIPSRAVKTKEN